MLIKNYENLKYDTLVQKVRGIIIDENNRIMIIKIEDNYALPGGDIEDGENKDAAIKRELAEEIGLYIDNIDYLVTFIHYHEHYLYIKSVGEGTRININHYYLKRIHSSELKKNNPTDFEKEHHIEVHALSYDEIITLTECNGNSLRCALNEEIKTILKYCKHNKII